MLNQLKKKKKRTPEGVLLITLTRYETISGRGSLLTYVTIIQDGSFNNNVTIFRIDSLSPIVTIQTSGSFLKHGTLNDTDSL